MSSKFHKDLTGADLHVPGYAQTTDPGAVGAGKYWLDISEGKMVIKVRDEANGSWRVVSGAFFGSTDPGAVGAGRLWVDTSLGVSAYILKVRNVTNSGWVFITASFVSDGTNSSTAAEIRTDINNGTTHRADSTIHRSINDGLASSTGLWSSSKTKSSVNDSSPIGTVISFAGAGAPSGLYLLCDGTGISTSYYPDLYTVIGYTFGGSGSTFNLPDLRNQFIRGAGGVRGSVGSLQGQDVQAHTHPIQALPFNRTNTTDTDRVMSAAGGSVTRNTDNNSGSETRPANIALAYWVKALNV
jgi:microcystin-dependent protein